MAKFVEMDERVKFKDQIEQKMIGSGILINKFNVKSNKIEQFLKDWAKDALTSNNNLDYFYTTT